ncbi:MAG: GatB/YqeY domain-containing protein [Jatrophihabitans sp.]
MPDDLSLTVRLRRDLTTAMKRRDATAMRAIRSALALIANAEAVDAPAAAAHLADESPIASAATGLGVTEAARTVRTDQDIAELLRADRREQLASADEYDRLGQSDRAVELRAEADTLSRYLD